MLKILLRFQLCQRLPYHYITFGKLTSTCIIPEHTIPEIRTRAINNVQSKFQSCRTDLQDLVVDLHDLVKHLMKWFELKPVTHVKQILEILLILLKVNIMHLNEIFTYAL